eukprot:2343361-Alexandrium_andersonii.AAC.1
MALRTLAAGPMESRKVSASLRVTNLGPAPGCPKGDNRGCEAQLLLRKCDERATEEATGAIAHAR